MNQQEHWNYTIREWESEPFISLLDEAFSKKVDVVWDVGACVGGWSHIVANRYPVKDIYAFEPFEDNFKALVENMEREGDTAVTPVNLGIWYGKKQAKAIWRGSNVGAIFVDEVDTTDNVDTHKLFELGTLEEVPFPRPDLIKLDVEGAEKNIFEHSTMLEKVPQIILEWHFVGVDDAVEYCKKWLPEHRIAYNIQNGMFLLRRV